MKDNPIIIINFSCISFKILLIPWEFFFRFSIPTIPYVGCQAWFLRKQDCFQKLLLFFSTFYIWSYTYLLFFLCEIFLSYFFYFFLVKYILAESFFSIEIFFSRKTAPQITLRVSMYINLSKLL